LRIGIDVSWAQMGPSGTATYVAGLVEALTRVGAEHDYVLFTRRPERYGPALPDLDRPNIARMAVDAPLTNLRQQVGGGPPGGGGGRARCPRRCDGGSATSTTRPPSSCLWPCRCCGAARPS